MSDNITWMDGGFLFEINKQYNDLGQEAVLSNQQSILDLLENQNFKNSENSTSTKL